MKFPITRESLQAFDYAREQKEEQEEENQKRLMQTLDSLCKHFKQHMPNHSKEKKYVWRHLISLGQVNQQQFIDKLKETFIGCDIIVDPLKTYLIIDWS